ncbi:MAG: methyltransferase domain-containing protein [Parvularculales bacterium]
MGALSSTIGTPVIFDRILARHHRARAAKELEKYNFLERRAVHDLSERIQATNRHFTTALQWGGTLCSLDATPATLKIKHLIHADSAEALLKDRPLAFTGDEEHLPIGDNGFDLIVSVLSLHKVNDVPGTLIQINRALRPDGLFLAALLGGNTLDELRHSLTAAEAEITGGASPRISPFADVRDMGSLLQRTGFSLPVVDVDHLTAHYDTMTSLMKDLRGMGEANSLTSRRRVPTRRTVLTRADDIYRDYFGLPDGRLPAQFDILYLTGWSPHESQPRPLKPGSARLSLTQVLPDNTPSDR